MPVFEPLVCPIEHAGGFYVYLVKSSATKDPHQVSVCDTYGAVWCSCPDFWFRQQVGGIPYLTDTARTCKHIRAVIDECRALS